MTLSEFEIKRCEKAFKDFMEKRRPLPETREKLDYGWKLEGQSIEIFEIRPQWNNPEIIEHHSFAKATYINSMKIWEIYWMRGNLKWEKNKPNETAKTIEDVLEIIDVDEFGRFFG